jgi:hypothetical protein
MLVAGALAEARVALRELPQSPLWRSRQDPEQACEQPGEQARTQTRRSKSEIPIPRHGVTVARTHPEALTLGAPLFLAAVIPSVLVAVYLARNGPIGTGLRQRDPLPMCGTHGSSP